MTENSTKSSSVLPIIGALLLIGLAALLWRHSTEPGNPGIWIPQWQVQNHFHIPRRALAAAAGNGHLYVVGGMDNDNQYVAKVEYAAIHADGSLGPWQFTSRLEEPRFYLSAVIADGYLYAIGGANGQRGQDNIPSATVERAPILKDGSLGPWKQVAHLTTPRRGLQAATYKNHIYAIGGYDGIFLKSVERTDLDSNGNLSPWRLDPERSTVDRYIHSATALDDKLYLLGGHEQSSEAISYGDVEMSRINADGTLNPWEIQKTVLKTPRFIAAAFAMKHYIYMLGGHDGRNRLRSVEMAPLDSEGRVGPWSFTTSLHDERSATSLATYQDKVYVLGGMGVGGALDSVEMAQQDIHGHLGHWKRGNQATKSETNRPAAQFPPTNG